MKFGGTSEEKERVLYVCLVKRSRIYKIPSQSERKYQNK